MKLKNMINYERMETFMNAPIDWFCQFGKAYDTPDGILIYRDNGSNILSVAHLDSVNDMYHFNVVPFEWGDTVFSTHIDDRLGAYIIIEILPQLDVRADLLLTEGEEKGKSTAAHFTTTKQYNWMFSFDRRGTDVVHYRYNMKPWLDALKVTWDKDINHGSNSDIDYLHKLGCCGGNVGTG